MHELSTSEAIADFILEEAKKREAERVLGVQIEIGGLSFLNPEQVKFWLELKFEKTIARGAKLNIKLTKPEISCPECGYKGKLEMKDDPVYHLVVPSLSCPRCGSSKVMVEKGRGCTVNRIRLLCP
jgi:hydrogenase nickel incorporation protein HypA/HybF